MAAGGGIRFGRQQESRRRADLALRGQRGKGQPLRRHLQQRRTPDVDLAHDAHDTRTPRRGFPHGAEDVGHPQEGQVAQHPVDGMDAQHPFQFRRSGTERHRRHCGQGARQDRQIHREHAPGCTDRGEEQWFGQPLCGRQPELYPRQGRGNRSCERHPDRRALHEYGRCRHRPGLDPGIDRFLRHRDRL